MNRKQRRKLAKRINHINDSDFKMSLFRAVLTSSSAENEKVLNTQGVLSERLYGVFFPTSVKTLGVCVPVINTKMDCTESLCYAIRLCAVFHNEISEYITLKNLYENCVFSCNYAEAEKIINKIQDKLGSSLWLCGQRLILAEQSSGLEGNKQLLAHYIDKNSRNMVINTLLEFLSYRAEENTSLNNYNEKVDKFLKHFEKDDVIYNYFSYKLRLHKFDFTDDMGIVLQVDSQISMIDMFNSLIEILQRATANKVKLDCSIINELQVLNESIHDFRINNLLMFNGINVDTRLKKDVLEIIELYTKQDYEKAIDNLSYYLKNNQNDFQMWIINIKCHILCRKKIANSNDVICDLYSIYSLDVNCIASKGRLMYALKKYSDTSWRYKILSIVTRKLAFSENNEEKIRLSLLNEHTVTPRFVSLLPCVEYKDIINKKMSMPISNTLSMFYPEQNLEKISSGMCYRNKLYRAEYLNSIGDYETALKCLESINEENNGDILYIKEKLVRRMYSILYEAGQYEKAIEVIVDAFFENENLIRRCNLKLIFEKLRRIRIPELFGKIEYPIFVYLCDKLNIKNHRIAFSNFLEIQGISNYEGLLNLINDGYKVVFFFEKICTQSVIKREVRLSKTALVASEIRIKILQKLIEVNPEQQKIYLDEISMITTKREINNRIRQVSQRKVYVDEEKIKLEKMDLFLENFQKYLLIKSFNTDIEGFDVTDSININSIKQIVNSMNESIKRSTQYSQTILALKELVTDITFEFLRNEHYGLDTYLSSRIRHGYCKSQLTKALREHHLMLTTSDDESPLYDVSQYWDNKVKEDQESDYVELKRILSVFTHDIEKKIQEIRKEWIRIKLDRDEVGMFDYTSFVSSILVIDKQNIVDFDFMYSTITSSLWDVTNKFLMGIRERILGELKLFYYQKLNDMEQEIKPLEDSSIKNIVQELNSNITLCRAKIANIMTEFANIFYKDDVLYEDYSLEDLAVTCTGIEKQIHADFDKADLLSTINGNKKLSGTSFSYFVEIIIMLLNNAITHAGYHEMSKLHLSLAICMNENDVSTIEIVKALEADSRKWSVENLLSITVKNNLSPDKDFEYISTRVADIFEHAKDPQMLKEYSMTEGGSGLYKIYKTINYNMSVPYVILYSVKENEFSLTLAVDATELLVKEE